MLNAISAFKLAIPVVALFVALSEDSLGAGTGADKKAKVIADVKAQLPAIAASMNIPDGIVALLCNDAILGMVIDLLVAAANAAGAFVKAPAVPQ